MIKFVEGKTWKEVVSAHPQAVRVLKAQGGGYLVLEYWMDYETWCKQQRAEGQ